MPCRRLCHFATQGDRGAGLLEYVLLLALVLFIAIPSVIPISFSIKKNFCRIMKQQWDVSEYFVESTGECKKNSSPISGFYW